MSVSAGVSQDGSVTSLTRSASFNHIPTTGNQHERPTMQRTISEVNLTQNNDTNAKLDPESLTTEKEVLRQSSLRLSGSKPESQSDEPIFNPAVETKPEAAPLAYKNSNEAPDPPPKLRSVSSTLVSLARKPWASRSPSPSHKTKNVKSRSDQANNHSNKTPNSSPSKNSSSNEPEQSVPPSPTDGLPRRRETLLRRNKKAVNTQQGGKNEPSVGLSRRPSLPSIRSKMSLDRSRASIDFSDPEVPPVPAAPTRHLPQLRTDTHRKKDDLWSVFRTLDADYQKYVCVYPSLNEYLG